MYIRSIVALAACTVMAAPAVFAQSKEGKMAQDDRKYFREMAQANLAEVETGKVAQSKASSDEVKQFAQHMVQDHGKMLDEQKSMARTKGVQVPGQPKKEHQAALKKLQGLDGAKFDQAYMSQMVKDHEKTLKTVQDAAKNAKDPQVKSMAAKAAPDIEKHLQMARQIADKTKSR